MTRIDGRGPVGKRILRHGRRAAVAYFAGDDAEPERDRVKLTSATQDLDMSGLNALAAMWMCQHPNAESGAAGCGGIWPRVSVEANNAVLSVLPGASDVQGAGLDRQNCQNNQRQPLAEMPPAAHRRPSAAL